MWYQTFKHENTPDENIIILHTDTFAMNKQDKLFTWQF